MPAHSLTLRVSPSTHYGVAPDQTSGGSCLPEMTVLEGCEVPSMSFLEACAYAGLEAGPPGAGCRYFVSHRPRRGADRGFFGVGQASGGVLQIATTASTVRAIDTQMSLRSQSRTLFGPKDCAECPVQSTGICSAVDRSDLGSLERLGRRCAFQRRSALFMEGANADAVFNVISGVVRLYRLLPNGHRCIIGFGFPGDLLGRSRGGLYRFSAEAAEPTISCCFPRRAFADFLAVRPALFRCVHEATERELENAHDRMVLGSLGSAKAKVAGFLLDQHRRWVGARAMLMKVPLPMGRQDIGDFLGLSISTISRQLNQLARDKLIVIVPRGVLLLDLPRLGDIAAS